MKTVGVIGGMGPQATMSFEARFHRIAQRRIPQRYNAGYPPLVVVYLRHLPVMCDADGRPLVPFVADPRFLEATRSIGPLVDFLVMTSNTPHLFIADVERLSGRKVLSMIEQVLVETRARGWRLVGVMGFGEPRVYTQPLSDLGIETEILPETLRDDLDQAIRTVMEGGDGERERGVARRAVEIMRSRGVDGTILGCTEIPLLLGEEASAADLLDPLDLLAEAAVQAAIEEA